MLPDAITLNMLTPGKGGWDALYELKKVPDHREYPHHCGDRGR